jgi:flagellar L-ring protein FlgH
MNIILPMLLLISIISGCKSTIDEIKNIGVPPKFSNHDAPLSWEEDQETHKISNKKMPNSLWQPGSRGFFRDTKARAVGDILKVKIAINDQAKLNNQTQTARKNGDNFGLKGLFGLQTQLHKVIPMPDGDPLVGTSSNTKSDGNGSIDRKERIQTEIAAMVRKVLPNGNLIIVGTQEVRINYELRELTVSGIIRPEDIGQDNSVGYDQIAEARISYGGRGNISSIQKPRWGAELLDKVLPW